MAAGSYDLVAAAAKQLLSEGHRFLPQAVVTGANPEVSARYLHLADLGFHRVALRPVRLPPEHPLAINASTIEGVKRSYTEFVNLLFSFDDDTLLHYLLKIWTEGDFLGRFMLRVGSRQTVAYRCPAGKSDVCVDTNGDIYACPGMVGVTELRMGTVFAGITRAAERLYGEDLLVTRKRGCRECWARHLCGGGCYHAAYLATGRVDSPDPYDCALTKHLIELAIYTLGRLTEERPAVYAALPFPVTAIVNHLSVVNARRAMPSAGTGPPLDAWRSPDPMRFDRAEQMKERLWGGPGDLSGEVHIRWDDERLYLMVEQHGHAAREDGPGPGLDLYLVSLAEATASRMYPDWWDEQLPHYRASCDVVRGVAVVSAGTSGVGTAMQPVAEAPLVVERGSDSLRLGAAVPWQAMPVLGTPRERQLAVNASLRPTRAGSRQSGMQWLPDRALGVLQLVQ